MKRILAIIILSACAAPLAAQGISDDFEAYTPGNLCTQSTWQEWCGSVDVCGEVSTEQASSGANSLKLVGNVGGGGGLGDDTVHRFSIVGGQWTFKLMTYCPGDMTGTGFLIMLNSYLDESCAGTNNWSLQVWLDADLGTVHADFDNEELPLIRDRWVEFRAEIDLDADQVDYYYDGVQFVFDKSWKDGVSGGGVAEIRALDLYSGEPTYFGSSGHYIDDVSLAAPGLCATNGCGAFTKMVCKPARGKVVVKGTGTVGLEVEVAYDGTPECATVNDRGKWKVVKKNQAAGTHTAAACGDTRSCDI
ncbi:MAG: hypothetical protein IT449_02195 [Phycisphaerales bacterium]|nr:hypothetical protein [Phycisphaerales bacterium]